MNTINNNASFMSFQARPLVPLSKYSGVPKLSQKSIDAIKNLEGRIAQAQKEILSCENSISRTECTGNDEKYFRGAIAIIKKYVANNTGFLNNHVDKDVNIVFFVGIFFFLCISFILSQFCHYPKQLFRLLLAYLQNLLGEI